jgi:magnesium transporter
MEKEYLTSADVISLISEKKFTLLKEEISLMEAADIAEIFEELDSSQQLLLFRLLQKEIAAEVFVELDSDTQERFIGAFSDAELRAILDELFVDDTVDIVEEMPAIVVKRILRNCDGESRRAINEILKYPENSAGSIMTTEYVRLKEDMTVDEALNYIRRVAIDKETIYTCYVTDAKRSLVGVVSAKSLLVSDRETKISDIMEENVVSVNTLEDKEDVALTISRYDVLALPVVDAEKRLVGIVTVDDAIDVIHEAADEDFAKMAAITPDETPYLKLSVWSICRSRFPWLALLMLSATFTGMIITAFEESLARVVVLTAFIPMLMGAGGNSGSQASVTVIRGLSMGEIKFKDMLRVLFKELRVSFLCGAALATVAFAKIVAIDKYLLGNADITWLVAATVSITLALTVIFAKLLGCALPLAAEKLGFDPAVMASPMLTTLVDAISLLIYFGVASVVLGI